MDHHADAAHPTDHTDQTERTDPTQRPSSATERDELSRRVNAVLEERGVRFGGAGGHAFRADPVPRLLDPGEWDLLADGLAQRIRALDAFVADVYAERRCVADGVVPAHVLDATPYLEPDLTGSAPVAGAWISVAGFDVVRDEDGTLLVLEDNVRTPSGMAYAMAVSEAVSEVLGVESSSGLDECAAALRRCLEATNPGADGALVLVTDGPENSAYYEHRRLADEAGLELVEPDGLRRDGDGLRLADGTPVRAVYRRTEQDGLTPRDAGVDVASLLLEPWRAGQVGMVNCYGTGVADDKSVYAHVDEMVRYYLHEEPRVRSVPTYDLTDADRLQEALDRLPDLVAKPRDGAGGEGVVIGPTASADQLAATRQAMRDEPKRWIVQDVVSLSTQPTIVDGVPQPRHVDLRPFVFFDGREVTVPRGGLTRVALEEGQMVVNSSQDGGAKATWVG
ncbi:circularly permuted type 2 ATP-grasp protein [Nocardioides cavernae]|uniref:Circularly permuted type 2 ATP-grasp protein n=1 Tax=Nocardioides cavernae TaxID=1921566 RepID=A0ABR8NGE9_9ACTN|nr:circularly permuted type 2 ATP-grasp protein [Nocardioides cavernae]MBD3926791.1 circularly permuted type 2 ATP-grasp protein [Nocardioides cavernae]MBM7512513.1 putative circularly permuted ATP-grasp superfamily protein [Nocardioides cavernae]